MNHLVLPACVVLLGLVNTDLASAQHPAHNHAHSETAASEHVHGVHQHDWELGLSPALVYLVNEQEFAFGLHTHIVYNLAAAWGLGIGYERVFDEHAHNTASVVLQARIIPAWSVVVAPGVTVPDSFDEANPSVHLETLYEFSFDLFHIGPVIELALDPHDTHISLGLHVALGV